VQSHETYVIVGGAYYPKKVLSGIVRASVPTNMPTLTYTDNFGWTPQTGDTLFYVASDKVFIVGTLNMYRYYAWQKRFEPNAPDNSTPAVTDFTALTTTAINNAKGTNDLLAYFEAQCWYRIFIQDPSGTYNDKMTVRRNHYYDVNISLIKGPGIADPSNFVSDTPTLDQDTYVTATIKVLPWHKVTQNAEVDQN
jgi:hypothetical protein